MVLRTPCYILGENPYALSKLLYDCKYGTLYYMLYLSQLITMVSSLGHTPTAGYPRTSYNNPSDQARVFTIMMLCICTYSTKLITYTHKWNVICPKSFCIANNAVGTRHRHRQTYSQTQTDSQKHRHGYTHASRYIWVVSLSTDIDMLWIPSIWITIWF